MPTRRSPFWRYTAFQIPGWTVAVATAWWLYRSVGVPGWVAVGLPVGWFIKDMALYPLLSAAYDTDDTAPIDRLIGSQGRPVEPLAPHGYVRIGGELWRAETAGGARIEPDVTVEVVEAKGLIVRVRAVTEARAPREQ